MTTIDQALSSASRTIYENQQRQAETVHRLLNAVWVANQSIENGIRDVQLALATDWPTMPKQEPQALDDVLDDMDKARIEPPDTDPETMARIERIAAQFVSALPPPTLGPPPERDR